MQNDIVKITNAVYKIVEFFPDEVLKTKAKEQALLVLESVKRGKAAKQIVQDIDVLESYLKLGKLQGFVSDMNFLIVAKEYQLVASSLQQEIRNPNIEIPNKSQIQNNNLPKTVKSLPVVKPQPASKVFEGRQGKIISILKQKQKAQVADLIKQLPNVTKRTIRRDLDVLLREKAVMRVGEFNQVFYQLPN